MENFFEAILSFFRNFAAFFTAILTALGIMTPEKPPEVPKITQTAVIVFEPFEQIRTVEGGCTDGRFFYQIMINPDAAENEVPCRIIKIDPEKWEVVLSSEELRIDHANDMTYDEENNLLVISNNKPNYTTITFVDPEKLEITGTKTLDRKIYSITYVGTGKCWYAGISNSCDIVRYDENFNALGVIDNPENNYTRQSLGSDGEYLYSLFYNPNVVYKYDLQGNPQGYVVLPDTVNEAENIFFFGGAMFVGYNIMKPGAGGFIAIIQNAEFSTTAPIPAPVSKAA
ncbi:MAG: hypothetical protein IKI78_04080 [Clostridia bacterium]|nr:hypothetical protein [Clostridia bacterium]